MTQAPAAHHDLLRARLASLQIEGFQSREELAAALRELAAERETPDGGRSA